VRAALRLESLQLAFSEIAVRGRERVVELVRAASLGARSRSRMP
jgi:hypothetical protein